MQNAFGFGISGIGKTRHEIQWWTDQPPMFFVVVNLGVILWQIKPFLHDLQKKLSFKRNEQKLPYTIFFTFDFLICHA